MANFAVFIGCIIRPVSDTASEHECVDVCEHVYTLDVNHTQLARTAIGSSAYSRKFDFHDWACVSVMCSLSLPLPLSLIYM